MPLKGQLTKNVVKKEVITPLFGLSDGRLLPFVDDKCCNDHECAKHHNDQCTNYIYLSTKSYNLRGVTGTTTRADFPFSLSISCSPIPVKSNSVLGSTGTFTLSTLMCPQPPVA